MKTSHLLTEDLLRNMGLSLRDVMQDNQWVFANTLQNLPPEARDYVMHNHANLNIMHEMLRVECFQHAMRYNSTERTKRIIAALLHAQVLEYVYLKQIKTSDATLLALRKTQAFYRNYLRKAGITVPEPYLETRHHELLEQLENMFYDTTPIFDFVRLLVMRGRRMLVFSLAVFNTLKTYESLVMFFDPFIKSILVYQACVLLPRFIINLTHILEHLYSMTHPDNPSYQTDAAFQARCWELAYDFGWIVHGLLGALVLVGPLAPFAIYLTVLVPAYNLCVHTARFFVTRARFQNLEETYETLLKQTDNIEHQKEINTLLACLHEKSQHVLMPLAVRIGVCLSIISTASLILFLNINPWIPFIAAALAVLATLAGKVIPKYLPKQPQALDSKNFEYLPETLKKSELPQNESSNTVAFNLSGDDLQQVTESMFRKRKSSDVITTSPTITNIIQNASLTAKR
jgi:hypothetical protein